LLYFNLLNKTDLIDKVNKVFPYTISYGQGFYPLEKNENSKWRWSKNVSDLYIHNNTNNKRVIIKFKATAITNESHVTINVNGDEHVFAISTKSRDIYFETSLIPRINTVLIKYN